MFKIVRTSGLLRERQLSEQRLEALQQDLLKAQEDLAVVQADAVAVRAGLTAQLDSARLEFEQERARLLRGFCPDFFGHSIYTNPGDLGFSLGSLNGRNEPPRVCRRPFGLSYAAIAGTSSMA
jgi:hypothetical protein